MKARQLRDLTDEDLVKKLAETRQELFNLRFQSATRAGGNLVTRSTGAQRTDLYQTNDWIPAFAGMASGVNVSTMNREYANKRIIITGGSAGIGLEIALAFARQGAHLALLARNPDKLAAACEACETAGGEAFAIPCDISQPDSVARGMADAIAQLGGLDGLVANSGHCRPGMFGEIPLDEVDAQLHTNINGTLHCIHHALPALLQSRGFLVITSSPAGSLAIYGFSLYGATKAAVNYLAHTLRQEYGDRGLHVHLLLPPDTDTPGYQQEVTLYPPGTCAILSSGKLHQPQAVAKALLAGMRKGKHVIHVDNATRFAMLLTRIFPAVWESFTKRAVKRSR